MKIINTSYALYYNKQENRVGYVFRNRFISEPILDPKYLQKCIAYIHNNPVKAKIEDFIDYKIIIQEYLNNTNHSLKEIIKNKDWNSKENHEFLKNLIIDLKEKSGLSFRSISQILKINKDTLRKLSKN